MEKVKSLLVFDVKGAMAHFRAFYTNSSSLSYAFPPRTTITGLIAGLLGWPRDSYYEKLSSENCCVALSIRNPIRKIMQTVNYVRTKSLNELNAYAGHTQIPLEVVLPAAEPSHEELNGRPQIVYRVYFSHGDRNIMQDLETRLSREAFVFPPYLGLSEFIASTKFVSTVKEDKIAEISGVQSIDIATVLNAEKIQPNGLNLDSQFGSPLQYMKERMPVEFDLNRKLKKVANFIYEKNLNKIKVILKSSCYRVDYDDGGVAKSENIVFME